MDSGDCVGVGKFNFGPNELPYESQIAFQFTCWGRYNSITSGNGGFGCASGYEVFVLEDDYIVMSELYLCGSFCPYYM